MPPRERRGLCRGLPRRVGVVVSRSFTWMRAHVLRVLSYGPASSGGRRGAMWGLATVRLLVPRLAISRQASDYPPR